MDIRRFCPPRARNEDTPPIQAGSIEAGALPQADPQQPTTIAATPDLESLRPSLLSPPQKSKRSSKSKASKENKKKGGKVTDQTEAKKRKFSPSMLPSTPSKKLSLTDAKMMSQRRLRDAVSDAPYDFEAVPRAGGSVHRDVNQLLNGSIVAYVEDREAWHLTELLQLCNEAAWRGHERSRKVGVSSRHPPEPKPLMLEYLSDRLDTDDPLWGFQVRSKEEGWLQGFVLLTKFTTWAPYFRFDSRSPSCGITADDYEARQVDKDGSLARELEEQPRWGDPDDDGVVFSTIAEISLLGALGCGAFLMTIAMEQLRRRGFRYVVLQATDNAIPFYESLGFKRIGCVARPVHTESPDPDAEFTLLKRPPKAPHMPSDPIPTAPENYYWFTVYLSYLLQRFRWIDLEGIFHQPVNLDEVPEYLNCISSKQPMDLGTMHRKLVAFQYENLESFEADLELICSNATEYNSPASIFHQKALNLRRQAQALIQEFKRQCPVIATTHRPQCDETMSKVDLAIRTDTDSSESIELSSDVPSPSDVSQPAPTQEVPSAFDVLRAADETMLKGSHSLDDCGSPYAFVSNAIKPAADQDKSVSGYVHWTFPDQNVEDQYPSFMMARRLDIDEFNDTRHLHTDLLSPEIAAGFPRGVTPQGSTLVAKWGSEARGYDYLGHFANVEEARQVYEDVAAEEASLLSAQPTRLASVSTVALGPVLYERLAHLAVSQLPAVKPFRLCWASQPDSSSTPQSDPTSASYKSRKRKRKLYNKIVKVVDLPPQYPYKYWFVYQYVPDMEWCHLCPLHQVDFFKIGARKGRPRYKLVPEGEAREIDVPASRCQLVQSKMTLNTPEADKEVFDITDEEAPLPVSSPLPSSSQQVTPAN